MKMNLFKFCTMPLPSTLALTLGLLPCLLLSHHAQSQEPVQLLGSACTPGGQCTGHRSSNQRYLGARLSL